MLEIVYTHFLFYYVQKNAHNVVYNVNVKRPKMKN